MSDGELHFLRDGTKEEGNGERNERKMHGTGRRVAGVGTIAVTFVSAEDCAIYGVVYGFSDCNIRGLTPQRTGNWGTLRYPRLTPLIR